MHVWTRLRWVKEDERRQEAEAHCTERNRAMANGNTTTAGQPVWWTLVVSYLHKMTAFPSQSNGNETSREEIYQRVQHCDGLSTRNSAKTDHSDALCAWKGMFCVSTTDGLHIQDWWHVPAFSQKGNQVKWWGKGWGGRTQARQQR